MTVGSRAAAIGPHPPVQLGSASALKDLDLSAEGLAFAWAQTAPAGELLAFGPAETCGAGKDVSDAFYNVLVEETASWFCLREAYEGHSVKALGITKIYDDHIGGYTAFEDTEPLWPAFVGLSMGWPW